MEALASDGRGDDFASRLVWLKVTDNEGEIGWVFINPQRFNLPDGLLERLPVAEWQVPTPVPTPTGDPVFILKTLCRFNVNPVEFNPNPGHTIRFHTPIQINPGGIAMILESIQNIERLTNGLVTFEIVDHDPQVGIVVDWGDAWNPSGTLGQGCGNVSPSTDPGSQTSKENPLFKVGPDGYINSVVYIHLGSPTCDVRTTGGSARTRTSTAEHEIAHALGLSGHFQEYEGGEGFSYHAMIVIDQLYSMPSGMDMTEACAGQ